MFNQLYKYGVRYRSRVRGKKGHNLNTYNIYSAP